MPLCHLGKDLPYFSISAILKSTTSPNIANFTDVSTPFHARFGVVPSRRTANAPKM